MHFIFLTPTCNFNFTDYKQVSEKKASKYYFPHIFINISTRKSGGKQKRINYVPKK
jgi:hypothetical protein